MMKGGSACISDCSASGQTDGEKKHLSKGWVKGIFHLKKYNEEIIL